MLIASCILDIGYTLTSIYSMLTLVYVDRKVYDVIRNPLLANSPAAATFAFEVQMYFIFLSVIVIPIQYMYRYKVVTSPTTSLSVVLWPLLISATYLAIHMSFLPYTFQVPSEKYDKILEDGGAGKYVGVPYFVGDADVMKWLNLHLLDCVMMITVSYAVTYIYYRKTQKYLRRYEKSVSPSTLKAQRQVGMVLALQAIYPLIVLGVPSLIGNLAPILGLNSTALGNVLICTVHTTPVLNALAVIVLVPAYRRATVSILRGILLCRPSEFKRSATVHASSYTDTHRQSTIAI
ncbi:unnamed protein product [Bursaphelenchus xylophilus]|uniref:(pine wood nematode) hypothetical protein n=1 Tax=Bursaphelenchus xylophilus TaxID=6326 RepID=A0A7I8WHD8_BURXY|nr:unnamed protein product [Bursaphelenchus xylophilus]CAG9109978.1 unnamed protein product [Bursaphelenchus xylophilus]